jgi:nitrogen fixation NifU-like protein
VKGKSIEDVTQLIGTFKGLMSIHEAALGDGGSERADGDGEPVDLAKLGELSALQGVVKFPVRIKCATLSWNALAQGLDELTAASR